MSTASGSVESGSAPSGITEHPPPPPPAGGGGAGLAVPEMVATAGVPPPDRPSEAVPLYAPAVLGDTVTVVVQLAPAATVVLLQLSTEEAMIAGWDMITAPTLTATAFGLV